MEGERERLNRRISALTGKLADAKFSSDVEVFNVRSALTSYNQDIAMTEKYLMSFVLFFLLAAVTRTDAQIHTK